MRFPNFVRLVVVFVVAALLVGSLGLATPQETPQEEYTQTIGNNGLVLPLNKRQVRFSMEEWGPIIWDKKNDVNPPYYMILKDKIRNKKYIYVLNRDDSGSLMEFKD